MLKTSLRIVYLASKRCPLVSFSEDSIAFKDKRDRIPSRNRLRGFATKPRSSFARRIHRLFGGNAIGIVFEIG